jgi:hypothetical protein
VEESWKTPEHEYALRTKANEDEETGTGPVSEETRREDDVARNSSGVPLSVSLYVKL